jgi:hypothetical protein
MLLNTITSTTEYQYTSLVNQTLGFTITNISATYAVCGSAIVMCMFATTLRNLIYKVLNLAVLSVFVVALWAYLTDVTFIYVVYILTFVSAVVMLFLSVVLMLPSSALAVPKRASLPPMFVISANTSEVAAPAGLGLILAYIFMCTVIIYLGLAFIRGVNKNIITFSEIFSKPIKLFCNFDSGNSTKRLHEFILANSFYSNSAGSQGPLNVAYCSALEQCRFNFEQGYDRLSILPRFAPFILQPLMYIAYEFLNFYFRRLELKIFLNSPAYVQGTARLRSFARANTTDIESAFYLAGQRRSVAFRPKSLGFTVTANLYTPWWSPFAIFGTSASFIKLLSRWSLKRKHFFNAGTLTDLYHAATDAFHLHPLLINELVNKNLASGRYKIAQILHKNLMSIFYTPVAVIERLVGTAYRSLNIYLETGIQAAITLSIFFIALPYGSLGRSFLDHGSYFLQTSDSSLENLAAIQQGLYIGQPLLLLVSITGLLVALVGAPFFVARDSRQ